MGIVQGQNGNASDFVSTSSGASDSGKVAKLASDGKIAPQFITDPLKTTGADGNLTITSGTTTIDCAGAKLVVKNYEDISITGSGKLSFSNPNDNGTTIILNCRSFTVTSSANPAVDASGMGGKGGDAVTTSSNSTTIAATDTAKDGYGLAQSKTNRAIGAAPGSTPTADFVDAIKCAFSGIFGFLIPGAGGSGGGLRTFDNGGNTVTSGAGGRGGGCLIVNCAGNWNVTSNISVAGADATGASGSVPTAMVGGGGGGGGGSFLGIYVTLVANSGSVVTSGGAKTNCIASSATGVTGTGGGGGGSQAASGGATSTCGGFSSNTGGDGATGFSLVTKNTGFL